MEEMCLSKDKSLSNKTPRFRQRVVGERMEERKAMEMEENLRRCWGVPTRRNSVFDGLMERRLEENQLLRESRAEEKAERRDWKSVEEKEMLCMLCMLCHQHINEKKQ